MRKIKVSAEGGGEQSFRSVSYGEPRRESLDVLQGNINSHHPQDELVLGFLQQKK